ncbi:MAG: PDZ domain-containing protein [Gammaproteobacteria bacterium]|nr:PDZ domain-containing protein [Gammaproteobacteria bacterium]
MRSSIISLSLAAIIGIVIGLLLQSPTPAPPGSPAQATTTNRELTQTLAALAQQLEQETLARQQLEGEVATLGKRLTVLAGSANAAASVASAISTEIDKTPATPPTADEAPATAAQAPATAWFNQQALIDAGMAATEAEQLKTHFEQLELEKLYLRDQAIREGWSGAKRYREEYQKLEAKSANIKQTLGENAYDAYLFAAGQANRIAVQSVLSGSAASLAGMQSGDQVIRYNGERIYNGQDLRNATTQGDSSESVSIEILRDKQVMQFYVPRGPLGIRMNSISVAP